MTRLMDSNLKHLSDMMSEMGDLAICCIELAISSYIKGTNPINQVRDLSARITDRYHEVGDLTFNTILKFQPVAFDFRFIRSTIEISYTLHRFGRYAYDITLVRDRFGDISNCKTEWLYQASNETLQITKNALQSFALLDTGKANLIQADEEYVDKLYLERITMLANSDNVRCALAEAMLLKYLERIADHAMHMSKAVNYIVTGKHDLNSANELDMNNE